MNPVFVLLVIIGAALLWFLLSFAFPWVGKIALKIWRDAKYNINIKENEKQEEKQDER